MGRRQWFPVVAATALGAVGLVGCVNYAELAYRQDHRLEFTAPQPYELVSEPVTLTWKMDGFRVAEPGSEPPEDDAGYFAVFVDRAPVKPGRTLDDIASRDEPCLRDPRCPDAEYLADRGVYTTTRTSLDLASAPAQDTNETVQLHEATVVLLDTEGRRIGETAWYLPFKLEKRSLE